MLWPEKITFIGDRAADVYGRVIGPDSDGRCLRITEAVYDPETGLTRASLTPLDEPDFTGEQVHNPDTRKQAP